jgi:hypothetical protein
LLQGDGLVTDGEAQGVSDLALVDQGVVAAGPVRRHRTSAYDSG